MCWLPFVTHSCLSVVTSINHSLAPAAECGLDGAQQPVDLTCCARICKLLGGPSEGGRRAHEDGEGSAALALGAVPSPCSALPPELGMEEVLVEVLGSAKRRSEEGLLGWLC